MASDKVMEMNTIFAQDDCSSQIVYQWDKFHQQREGKVEEWKELRNYIFATDTTTTSNSALPWKNSTTLPKLCQIRDNLHANYLSALFPNDNWLKWEGYTLDDALKTKSEAIEAYMENKTRESHFRTEMSNILLDYIQYGNAFATVDYENRTRLLEDGSTVVEYTGPVVRRISPMDIVFNPMANNIKHTFKIVRSVKTLGEIKKMAMNEPDNEDLRKALEYRDYKVSKLGAYTTEDFDKYEGYEVDGFGNLYEYYSSGYVELLDFYGDWYDESTGELKENVNITIMDRAHVVRERKNPSWFGQVPIYHCGWRLRTDNLWAMGPLDNLVGMQYRIDHLENIKADASDLAIHPPLVINGEVEEFEYGPGVEIHIDENGSVQELARNVQWVIQADNQINALEQKMEQFAGAPSEAMGIRTAGEKTAFEVQQLQNAAGRIFQEKINTFEVELLEPILNAMLETARRHLNTADTVRIFDDELGTQIFTSITKEDITSNGKLRPMGARHFAAEAQLMQNLTTLGNSQIGNMIAPHVSTVAMAKLIERTLGLEKYQLVKPNVAVEEQLETEKLARQGQEDLQMEQKVAEGELDGNQDETQDVAPQQVQQ
jgi:hypothetical protein